MVRILVLLVSGSLALLGPIVIIVFLLPEFGTNALFLRSFTTDSMTLKVRGDIQAALGSRFRLSGIRDPSRRRSVLDTLGLIVFAARYGTPRYGNLEGGSNWFKQIQATITKCQCVFIDARKLTRYVDAEARSACRILGPERVFFVVDESKSESDWQHLLSEVAGARVESGNFFAWRLNEFERKNFRQKVVEFRKRIQALPNVLNSVELVDLHKDEGVMERDVPEANYWSIIAVLICVGLFWQLFETLIVMSATTKDGTSPAVVNALTTVNYSIMAFELTVVAVSVVYYLAFCALNRRRILLILCLAVVAHATITYMAYPSDAKTDIPSFSVEAHAPPDPTSLSVMPEVIE